MHEYLQSKIFINITSYLWIKISMIVLYIFNECPMYLVSKNLRFIFLNIISIFQAFNIQE